MSVVAGIEHGSEVWMAADSLVTDDNIVFETTEPPKVFKKGQIIYGTVGSFRVGGVVFEAFESPGGPLPGVDPWLWMIRDFVPRLKEVLKKHDVDTKPKVVEDEFRLVEEWQLMVGLRAGSEGRIYIVDDDFSVARAADGYAFIGSGGEVAAGALFATGAHKPGNRIKQAVAAACKHVPSVGGKIIVESI